MNPKYLLLFALVALFTVGCSTKQYGRMQPLTGIELSAYTCKDIKVELAKIDAFELQVAEGAEFDVLSVASFLGDFGIGNTIEKNSALKTAKKRRVQLNDLSTSKGC